MRPLGVILLVAVSCVSGCSEKGPPPPVVFPDTPEGVVLKLEEAYRKHDLDAAAACRAFQYEGELEFQASAAMVKKSDDKSPPEIKRDAKGNNISVPSVDENPAAATIFAGMREFDFRDKIQRKGFPSLVGGTSTVTDKKVGEDGVVTMTLVRKYADGNTTTEQVHAVKSVTGWKVFVRPE